MTQLYIEGEEIALPSDFSFDLTLENPYFDDAGEYTSEVFVNAKAETNIRTFGNTGRIDVTHHKMAKDCRLVCDNIPVIVGTATVVEYNDENTAIQLLGGNSHINFFTRNNEMYIDQMDLGDLVRSWEDVFPQGGHPEFWNEQQARRMMSRPEDKEWIMLPAYDEEREMQINALHLYCVDDHKPQIESRPLKEYSYPYSTAEPNRCSEYALQPRLTAVIRRVIKSLGFEIDEFDAEETPMKYIYLVNVRHTLSLAEILPHWTVSEFFDEVQKFLGCVFVFDSRTCKCSIKSRSRYFDEDVIRLEKVSDSFNLDIEDETNDVSDTNILYANADLKHLVLFDETANDNGVVTEVSSMEEVTHLLLDGLKPTDKSSRIAKFNDHFYIRHIDLDEDGEPIGQRVEMANHLGSDWKTGEGIGVTTLKIAPAAIDYYSQTNYAFDERWNPYASEYIQRIAPRGVATRSATNFDIDRYVHVGEMPTENKVDCMRVAVFTSWDDLPWETVWVRSYDSEKISTGAPDAFSNFPTKAKLVGGWTYDFDDMSEVGWRVGDALSPCMALRKMKGIDTVYSELIESSDTMQTSMPIEFTFYDDISMDAVNKTFVIRGHKYWCKKITLSVDTHGIAKKKTGTFYRVKS